MVKTTTCLPSGKREGKQYHDFPLLAAMLKAGQQECSPDPASNCAPGPTPHTPRPSALSGLTGLAIGDVLQSDREKSRGIPRF